jgi:hypothetical protein
MSDPEGRVGNARRDAPQPELEQLINNCAICSKSAAGFLPLVVSRLAKAGFRIGVPSAWSASFWTDDRPEDYDANEANLRS